MENYSQEQFKPRVKLSTIIFLGIQAIVIILAIISIAKFFHTDEIKNSPSQGPSAKIINATNAIPEDYSGWTEIIEWALLDTILDNTKSDTVSKSQASAYFRDNSIKTQHFEKYKTNYVRAIIDIPDLKQSYEIILEYPDNKDAINAVEYSSTDVAKPYSILCLDENSEKIYQDFACHESPEYFTRQKIVSNTLKYFQFDGFSAYLNTKSQDLVIIQVSAIYENDDVMKAKCTKEVKDAIESLGISPDIFTYYIDIVADVDIYYEDQPEDLIGR